MTTSVTHETRTVGDLRRLLADPSIPDEAVIYMRSLVYVGEDAPFTDGGYDTVGGEIRHAVVLSDPGRVRVRFIGEGA